MLLQLGKNTADDLPPDIEGLFLGAAKAPGPDLATAVGVDHPQVHGQPLLVMAYPATDQEPGIEFITEDAVTRQHLAVAEDRGRRHDRQRRLPPEFANDVLRETIHEIGVFPNAQVGQRQYGQREQRYPGGLLVRDRREPEQCADPDCKQQGHGGNEPWAKERSVPTPGRGRHRCGRHGDRMRDQPIAALWDGLDETWPTSVVAQRTPEFGDGVRDCIVRNHAPGPDTVFECLSCNNLTGPFDKLQQHAHHLGLDALDFPVTTDSQGGGIDLHTSQLKPAFIHRRLCHLWRLSLIKPAGLLRWRQNS